MRAMPVRSLSTGAGTECVRHLFRAATDANLRAKVLSVDGTGACDHVLRAAMLCRLEQVPDAKALPPVRDVVLLRNFHVR